MNAGRPESLKSETCTPNGSGPKSFDCQDRPWVRDWLTVKEYALALDISYSTLRKQIDKAFHSADGFPFPGGAENPRNPWFRPIEEILIIHSQYTRRFSIPVLEFHRYPDAVRTRILGLAAEGPTDPRNVGRRPKAAKPSVSPRRINPGSTSGRLLSVIHSDPSRCWSIPEIIDKLEERGQLPRSASPRNVLQATLFRLTWETQRLERIGFGLYRLASHCHTEPIFGESERVRTCIDYPHHN